MWKGTYAYLSISINYYPLYKKKMSPAYVEVGTLIEAKKVTFRDCYLKLNPFTTYLSEQI